MKSGDMHYLESTGWALRPQTTQYVKLQNADACAKGGKQTTQIIQYTQFSVYTLYW